MNQKAKLRAPWLAANSSRFPQVESNSHLGASHADWNILPHDITERLTAVTEGATDFEPRSAMPVEDPCYKSPAQPCRPCGLANKNQHDLL